MRFLDGVEAVASTIYLVLVGFIVIAAIAALVYVARNAPPRFGTQGEWLYLGGGLLLLLLWAGSQLFTLIQRLYRRRQQDSEPSFELPRIQAGPGGLSLEWDPSKTRKNPSKDGAWTWSFESTPVSSTTIEIDESQIAAAQAAAESGLDWDDVCRKIDPGYDQRSRFEQELYQRAIRMSVEHRRSKK